MNIRRIKQIINGQRLRRSRALNLVNLMFLALLGIFMLIPFVFALNNAFKPLDELFIYPPRLFVSNPTTNNFTDLFVIMSESILPFSRYIFNTFFVTIAGTAGHVIFASLASFIMAKYNFFGKTVLFNIIILSLLFVPQVTAIPNYITMSQLRWIDTPFSLIIPAFGAPLGFFLMKQFMEVMVPDEILESARIDGASILKIFYRVIMPMVKPAWLTLIIFSIQALWSINSGTYIIGEEWKTLPYALSQILAGGFARVGVGSAVAVVMMAVPITAFILAQGKIVETMSTSGIK